MVGQLKKALTSVDYVDSDFAEDFDKISSLAGYLFTIGGCTVNWITTLQSVIALSTTEAKYTELAEAFKEVIWLRGMVTELEAKQGIVTMHYGSQESIHPAKARHMMKGLNILM